MCDKIHYVEAEGLVHVRSLCQSRDRATVVSETIYMFPAAWLWSPQSSRKAYGTVIYRPCCRLLGITDCVLGC